MFCPGAQLRAQPQRRTAVRRQAARATRRTPSPHASRASSRPCCRARSRAPVRTARCLSRPRPLGSVRLSPSAPAFDTVTCFVLPRPAHAAVQACFRQDIEANSVLPPASMEPGPQRPALTNTVALTTLIKCVDMTTQSKCTLCGTQQEPAVRHPSRLRVPREPGSALPDSVPLFCNPTLSWNSFPFV